MKKVFLHFIILLFSLSGCAEKQTLDQQKAICNENGGTFEIEKKLNYRTGEEELVGKCY
jgi:uncharacterized protein YceK